MSLGSRRIMPTGHPSNRNRRDLLHHLLVHLHQRTKVSSIARISEPNLPILRVVWHKEVVILLHVLSVVETTQGSVVMAPLVASRVAKMVISCENVRRTSRVMVMGAIEPSLLQLLHQTELPTSRGDNSGAGRGGNHLYAITSRQEKKDSPNVVTGTPAGRPPQ
ncbi:hypothetical protein AABB24_000652 [Solanum stoloniferum]|uniref:Uncharacterized protein n=1 Tax=Solanum stoloniferum TaxID=62892 RepID=A0ABD2VJI8_9SOLN